MREPEAGPELGRDTGSDVGDVPDPTAERGVYPAVEPDGTVDVAVPGEADPAAAAADAAGEEQRDGGWDRLWRGDTPTQPMPIVDRLRHTPYRMSRSPKELTASESEAQAAGEAIDITLRLG